MDRITSWFDILYDKPQYTYAWQSLEEVEQHAIACFPTITVRLSIEITSITILTIPHKTIYLYSYNSRPTCFYIIHHPNDLIVNGVSLRLQVSIHTCMHQV